MNKGYRKGVTIVRPGSGVSADDVREVLDGMRKVDPANLSPEERRQVAAARNFMARRTNIKKAKGKAKAAKASRKANR